MLAVSRQRTIMELLLERGAVKVSELSEALHVTEKTIREDLEKLEEKGLLERIHGGAVPVNERDRMMLNAPDVQLSKLLHEKSAIADKAVSFIHPGDIIALDGGSTTLQIAARLKNEAITVVTNDLMIIRELAVHDQIRLVVPGGHRHRNMLSLQGQWEWLQRLNIHKLFLSTTGIHPEYGLTIFTEEHAILKKVLLDNSKEVFCVADHSKFDKGALLTFANLSQLTAIITDDRLPEPIRDKYGEYVRIELANTQD